MLTKPKIDQAEGLRRMVSPRPVQVIAVTSGKGGVGKTNLSINLSIAMAQAGKEVLVLDADFGLANVDVLLGLHASHTLSDVLDGVRTLEEIILTGPSGVKIVPGSSGMQRMAGLSSLEQAGLIRAFSELGNRIDVLLIDTAAGISDSVINFTKAAQEILVVVCDEPASITDAYATIKVLNRDHGVHRFRIVANMVQSAQEGRDLYCKLLNVTDKFLDVQLDFMGVVPFDDFLKRSIQKQKAVVDAYPRSKAALAFKTLAQKADKWPVPQNAGGHVEFFIERLIHSNHEMEASL